MGNRNTSYKLTDNTFTFPTWYCDMKVNVKFKNMIHSRQKKTIDRIVEDDDEYIDQSLLEKIWVGKNMLEMTVENFTWSSITAVDYNNSTRTIEILISRPTEKRDDREGKACFLCTSPKFMVDTSKYDKFTIKLI